MPGDAERSRPQRPQQAVPGGGAAGTEERRALLSRLRGEQRPGPGPGRAGPGQRPRGLPARSPSGAAHRRAAVSPAQPPRQSGPAHSPVPPLQPGPPPALAPPHTAELPPPDQPGAAAAGPSDLKMAPLTSRRRHRPPGPAARGAPWERCRGDRAGSAMAERAFRAL